MASKNTRLEVMSIDEFTDRVHRPPNKDTHQYLKHQSIENSMGARWSGSESYEHALQMLDQGWPEGLNKIKFHDHKIRQVQPTKTFDFAPVFSECGSEVDVGRFLGGEPECMVDHQQQAQNKIGRVVRLVCNVSASCGISEDQFFRRGVAALRIVDALETAGYRCEITLSGAISGDRSYTYDPQVIIKAAEQPLDMDRLAFFMASPAIFRRLIFRLCEHLPPGEASLIGAHYGYPAEMTDQSATDIYVGTMHLGELRSAELVDGFIAKTLSKYLEPEAQAV